MDHPRQKTPAKVIWIDSPALREPIDTTFMSVARKWGGAIALYCKIIDRTSWVKFCTAVCLGVGG